MTVKGQWKDSALPQTATKSPAAGPPARECSPGSMRSAPPIRNLETGACTHTTGRTEHPGQAHSLRSRKGEALS